ASVAAGGRRHVRATELPVGVARLGLRAGHAALSSDASLEISIHRREPTTCPLTSVTVHDLTAIVFVDGHGCRLPVSTCHLRSRRKRWGPAVARSERLAGVRCSL